MAAHQLLEAPLEEEEGGAGARVEREMVVTTGGVQESHLDLSLGISLNGFGGMGGGGGGGHGEAKGGGGQMFARAAAGGPCGVGAAGGVLVPQQQARACSGLGAKRWFYEAVGGFVDPWSLAARQETAVLEQRRLAYRGNAVPTESHTLPRGDAWRDDFMEVGKADRQKSQRAAIPSPVVGWPPVRSFRKNLQTPLHPNPETGYETKDSKKPKSSDGDNPSKLDTKSTMFVKVNMKGYNVGRKIDLMAHSGYESLSSALQKMFHNFLSVDYSNNMMQNAKDEPISTNYVLLYEDNEGDQMLVGDVPWEMFISSVKRLYIASGSKDPKRVEDEVARNNKSKQFEHEVKANG